MMTVSVDETGEKIITHQLIAARDSFGAPFQEEARTRLMKCAEALSGLLRQRV